MNYWNKDNQVSVYMIILGCYFRVFYGVLNLELKIGLKNQVEIAFDPTGEIHTLNTTDKNTLRGDLKFPGFLSVQTVLNTQPITLLKSDMMLLIVSLKAF